MGRARARGTRSIQITDRMMDEVIFQAVQALVDPDHPDPFMRTSGGVALTLIREALDARNVDSPEPQPGDEVLVDPEHYDMLVRLDDQGRQVLDGAQTFLTSFSRGVPGEGYETDDEHTFEDGTPIVDVIEEMDAAADLMLENSPVECWWAAKVPLRDRDPTGGSVA